MSLPFRAFDGAFGTYYFQLTGDDGPCERANVDNPGLVRRIHRQYLEAGAEAIKTNTFAVNAQGFPDERERVRLLREGYGLAAEEAARQALSSSGGAREIRHLLQTCVQTPLADALLSDTLTGNRVVAVREGKLVVTVTGDDRTETGK